MIPRHGRASRGAGRSGRNASSGAQADLPFPAPRRSGGPARRKGSCLPPRLGAEESRDLLARLRRDGSRIAAHFELRFRAILAERSGVVGHYGICYEDGLIKIRLQHAARGTPLRYSSLVNTLCHELAHLRFFDHGVRFRGLYASLLRWARQHGIYRPGRAASIPRCGLTPGERRDIVNAFRDALRPGAPTDGRTPLRAQLPLFPDGP